MPHPDMISRLRAGAASGLVLAVLGAGLTAGMAVPPAMAVETTARTPMEEAMADRAGGNLDSAVIRLKNLLQANPDDLPARLLLGEIYLQQGAAIAAQKELSVARSLGASDKRITMLMARSYLLQGAFEDALREMGGTTPTAGDSLDTILVRGQALIGLGRYDEAAAAYQQARAAAPRSPEALTGLARVETATGDYAAARTAVDAVLADNPAYLDAWVAKGELAQARGDMTEAANAYGTAIDIAPERLQIRLLRAATWLDLGQLDKALADAEAVLAKVATEPQALFLKSQVLRRQGKTAEADAALRRSGDVLNNADQDALSSFPAMLRLAGIVNAALGQNGRAVTDFEKYLQHFPRDVTSLRWRAALALRLDKPADAVPYLERLLAVDADDVAGLNLMGLVQIELRRFDKALPYFQQAARLAPDNASTVGGLSASYKSLGDMDSAIAALTDAVSREPGNLASVIMLILAHLEDHDAAAARAVWKTADGDWQGTPLGRQLSAAIHVGDGDFDSARKDLQVALDQDAGFTPARLALARVELQTGHLDQANALYKAVLVENGDNPAAIDGMAQTALARRDFAEAVKWFRRAQDKAPENGQIARSIIDALARSGAGRDAEALAAAFLTRHPGSVPVLDVYTSLLNSSGRARQSMELYRNAISASAADPRYYTGLARAQLVAGDGNSALETFQRATRVFPVSLPLYRAYVRTALRLGASGQAAQAADELQARLPGNIDALALRADVLIAAREGEAAYRLYASVPPADIDGKVVSGLFRTGMLAGHGQAELPRLAQWVKDHPGDTDAKAMLAGAYQAFGNLQGAIGEYEALRPRLPQHPGLLNNLAWLYYLTGDPRARDTAKLAYEVAPDEANTADTYGWILAEAGDTEAALPLLRKARSLDASSPVIRFHLGAVLNTLGRTPEARSELEGALASGRPFDGIDRARTLLQQLTAAE